MEVHSSENPWLSQFSVRDKVVVITGSTRGIGNALARAFHELGARVWIHGRDPEVCAAVASDLSGLWVAADLADPDGVDHLCETVLARTEVVHCLINNAAMEVPRSVAELENEFISTALHVNVTAPVMTTRLMLPALKAAGGASVINVTSIHESVPYAHNSVYCMSKAALGMFTKTAAIELAPLDIRVTNLAPGAIETDINRALIDEIGRDRFADWIPAGRVGHTSELVGAALFLASSASSYVTGTTLYADGGYSQHLVRYRPKDEETS